MFELLTAGEIFEDRAIVLAQMIDVCTIDMPGDGKGVFNEATLQYDTPARIVVYGPGAVDKVTRVPLTPDTVLNQAILAGKCRVQVRSDINSNAIEAVVGEREWTYRTATLQLPLVGSEHIQNDYRVVYVSCVYDAAMVGRAFNLNAETKGKTHGTHRKFSIRELLG